MKAITNFAEAQTALRSLYSPQTKYDLTLMHKLMGYLGNPQDKLRVLHVAGTSGKTSTAYYIAALLKARGLSVGLTVSPHVDEVNERVQINLQPLAEKEFCAELTTFLGLIEKSEIRPSYFEALIALAYWVFAKKGVDYAVVEVGLGGLLDGTNVVSSKDKICIITDISLDHTEILGETVAEIAAQKAGIIHPGNEVFMYEQDQTTVKVVERSAKEQAAVLHLIPKTATALEQGLPLFQQRNLGLALQAVNFVLQRDGQPALSDREVSVAAETYIPARMERHKVGDKVLIIDGSHNAQKLSALAESIREAFPGQGLTALIAFVDGPDRRWQGSAEVLMGLADGIIITSFQAEQDVPKHAADPNKLQNYCKTHQYTKAVVVTDPAEAFNELLKSSEPVLLVAGSFYLLNSIRPLIMK